MMKYEDEIMFPVGAGILAAVVVAVVAATAREVQLWVDRIQEKGEQHGR